MFAHLNFFSICCLTILVYLFVSPLSVSEKWFADQWFSSRMKCPYIGGACSKLHILRADIKSGKSLSLPYFELEREFHVFIKYPA